MASSNLSWCGQRCWVLFLGYIHLLLDIAAAIICSIFFGEDMVHHRRRLDFMHLFVEILFAIIFIFDVIFIIFILAEKRKLYRCIYICGICFVVFLSLLCILGTSWFFYIYYAPGFQTIYYSTRVSLILSISTISAGVLIKIPQLALIKKIGRRDVDVNTVKFVNGANEAKCIPEDVKCVPEDAKCVPEDAKCVLEMKEVVDSTTNDKC